MAASTQKKKTTAKKSTASRKSQTSSRSQPAKKPIRREVWALVCVCLALFTFIGCFRIDALFITYFCGFVKGLIGYGYYILPLALLGCACILILHHGRPVRARTICMLCVPVTIGALAHLFLCKLELDGIRVTELLPVLYENGKEMLCGGLICGFFAEGLHAVRSMCRNRSRSASPPPHDRPRRLRLRPPRRRQRRFPRLPVGAMPSTSRWTMSRRKSIRRKWRAFSTRTRV